MPSSNAKDSDARLLIIKNALPRWVCARAHANLLEPLAHAASTPFRTLSRGEALGAPLPCLERLLDRGELGFLVSTRVANSGSRTHWRVRLLARTRTLRHLGRDSNEREGQPET